MELAEDQTESQNMPRNDDDRDPESLVVGLSKLQINPEQNRFFGKSRLVAVFRVITPYMILNAFKI